MNAIAVSFENHMGIMSDFLTREVSNLLKASINTSKSSLQNALFNSSLTVSIQHISLFMRVPKLKESGRLVQALLLISVRFNKEAVLEANACGCAE